MLRKHLLTLLLGGALLTMLGCADAPTDDGGTPPAGEELSVVPEGKADNYYSNVAAEYEMTGTIEVAMSGEDFADEGERDKRVRERLTAVGLYLTTYVTDKFRGIDINDDGEITDDEVFFHNEDYGGFHAMVRNYSLETEGIEPVEGEDGVYLVTFTVDVAGPPGLLGAIEGEWEDEGQTRRFEMQMPAGEAFSPSNVPRGTTRRFDPADYAGELETIVFVGRRHPEVGNAYPHFADFMADELYDITLFFGHDYNASRSDLREAEEVFDELESQGFEAPVDEFAELGADSGPFVKTMQAMGEDVRVEVRVFHSDMFTTSRRRQHDLALSELGARDVFFYPGHAGPYYGLYLDAAGAAQVDYEEFATYDLPADRQQFVVAQGCQTYSQYADMIYANPAKSEENLDVITTVNYSYGHGTRSILANLLRTDDQGNHRPVDIYRIIRDINNDWLNSWKDVFYGVMGVDGNPQLHPYVDLEALGRECSAASDCGDPNAHVCVDLGAGARECGAATLAEMACPSGTVFRQLASGSTIRTGACFLLEESDAVYGIVEGSEAAKAVLGLVNTAPFEVLDDEVGLDRRAAENIVAHRAGLDGVEGTEDDQPFGTLADLDAVTWVADGAFGLLQDYLGL